MISDSTHVHLEGRSYLEVIRAMRIGASAGAEVRRVVVLASSASRLDAEMLNEAFDMLKHEPRLAKATLEVKVRSPKAQTVRLRVRG